MQRAEALLRDWHITVEETRETPTSVLMFGRRSHQPVVLKVLRAPSDEWRTGEITKAFGGRCVVRVLEVEEGAALFERILPGQSLLDLVLSQQDDEATDILSQVIGEMGHAELPPGCTSVEDWSDGFDRYLRSTNRAIPRDLVRQAHNAYLMLCNSQK